jgi:putative ABC transport system permease protein
MFKLFDILGFTLERIRQHLLLVMWVLVGISVATTLALSMSLYVDSVYTDLLKSRLDDPPYAFRFRYLGAWNGNITGQDVENAGGVIEDRFTQLIDLPLEENVRFLRGGIWSLRMENFNLGTFSVGLLEGADEQITIVEGIWPPEPVGEGESVPVLLPETMLYRMGLQVGDEIMAVRSGGTPVTFAVAAMWRPVNADDPAWIFPPKFFDEVILVDSDTFWGLLEGVERPIDEAAWLLNFDGDTVRTSDVGALLDGIVTGQRDVDAVLPGIRPDVSPQEELSSFDEEVNQLTQQLFIIIAPVGGLVLYFVSLVAGLLVNRQQAEDVKLRSRGMSRRAILTVHVLTWLLLTGLALAIGMAASPLVVRLVGQTSSFLRFDDPSSINAIVLTPQSILLGGVTGLIAASSGLILAWRTTRQNINSFRQTSVRASKAWWQRAYLDVFVMLPAGYVLYTLREEGGLVTDANAAFSDPLAFIGPTLFAFGLALLFLRIWPAFVGVWARIIGVTRNIALLMALREMTRSISRYRGALLMTAFTLSLTGFTASMASTLDRSLADTIDYSVGADMVLITAVDTETEEEQSAAGDVTSTVTGYNVPPVSELLVIDGVESVSRVGRYTGRLTIANRPVMGTVLGVDRAALASVTRFREDFADETLAELLNKLAGQRTGILVNRQMATDYNLVIGQQVTLGVQALNGWYEVRVPIIDFVDYFPTLDPAEGFFVITNIDPIFEMVGTTLPHDVWMGLSDDAIPQDVEAAIRESGFPALRILEPEAELMAARAEPARRGVLGFLSVGFVASIALTLIAAIIQSTASFKAQSTQLGALRAMGLSGVSVAVYVIILQGMSTLSGIMSGTTIGVATTLLFLPLLDFSGGLPPYLVRVAWGDIIIVYTAFAGVLFTVTVFTTLMLSREQVSTIIRLGDA